MPCEYECCNENLKEQQWNFLIESIAFNISHLIDMFCSTSKWRGKQKKTREKTK